MIDELNFDEKGFVTAIVQDAENHEVLMTAFMNREAVEKTLETGLAHYWSRSRQKLWQKGETSGHVQEVKEIRADCDTDALLLKVHQKGVACHTGHRSCFYHTLKQDEGKWATEDPIPALFQLLYEVIMARKLNPPSDKSYVASLFAKGQDVILKKIGEESGEVIIASKNGKKEEVVYEMADLWFHSLVTLAYHNIHPSEVIYELQKRFGKSGGRDE